MPTSPPPPLLSSRLPPTPSRPNREVRLVLLRWLLLSPSLGPPRLPSPRPNVGGNRGQAAQTPPCVGWVRQGEVAAQPHPQRPTGTAFIMLGGAPRPASVKAGACGHRETTAASAPPQVPAYNCAARLCHRLQKFEQFRPDFPARFPFTQVCLADLGASRSIVPYNSQTSPFGPKFRSASGALFSAWGFKTIQVKFGKTKFTHRFYWQRWPTQSWGWISSRNSIIGKIL